MMMMTTDVDDVDDDVMISTMMLLIIVMANANAMPMGSCANGLGTVVNLSVGSGAGPLEPSTFLGKLNTKLA